MTFAAWVYKAGDGENNFGRILDFGDSDIAFYTDTDGKIRFNAKWNGANTVQWGTGAGKISLNEWTHIVVTYDATNSANDPKIYINGIRTPVSVLTGTKTGAYYGIVSQDANIGNRNAGDRTWEEQLADVAVLNETLTDCSIR